MTIWIKRKTPWSSIIGWQGQKSCSWETVRDLVTFLVLQVTLKALGGVFHPPSTLPPPRKIRVEKTVETYRADNLHYVQQNMQILAFFTMPARQIWSCHVTQEANFDCFLFCPNSTFNIRKSHKASSGKLSTSEATSKTLPGVGVENTSPPPQCL